MLLHVLQAARAVAAERVVVVLGHGHEQVEPLLPLGVQVALQERQLGTGHALLCAAPHILPGPFLVLCGDTPLIRGETLLALVEAHRRAEAEATLLTTELADPTGYGRVLRADDGSVLAVVEHRDAGPRERAVREVNSGVYVLTAPLALELLRTVGTGNKQGEVYLTDVITLLCERGHKVAAYQAADPDELRGVNSPEELAVAERLWAARNDAGPDVAGPDAACPEAARAEAGTLRS